MLVTLFWIFMFLGLTCIIGFVLSVWNPTIKFAKGLFYASVIALITVCVAIKIVTN